MSETIAVRLPNWLGDTVMAVPALRALRAGLPHARLIAVGPWVPLLDDPSLVDVVVDYPRDWRGRVRGADAVRRLRPAVAVLLPNSLEAALSAVYWGARRRLGFAAGGRSALLSDVVAPPSPRGHQIDDYLVLARAAGGTDAGAEPRLAPPAPAARDEARALLDAACGAGARPRVGIHLGAAYGSSKLWPLARVAEFCRAASAAGITPVLLGTGGDAAAAARLIAETRVASVVGRDRPALLPAVLSELAALVSGDTGVAHLAAALGTPVVALFGPTDPRLTAPRGRAEVLTHPVPCAPCFYRVCPIDHPCLDGIEPCAVLDRVQRLRGTAA